MEIERNALMALPAEIKTRIISYLGTDELLALSGTCKEIQECRYHTRSRLDKAARVEEGRKMEAEALLNE